MYTDGQEGYLFAPGDKKKAIFGMDKIYSDDELRASMGKAARCALVYVCMYVCMHVRMYVSCLYV